MSFVTLPNPIIIKKPDYDELFAECGIPQEWGLREVADVSDPRPSDYLVYAKFKILGLDTETTSFYRFESKGTSCYIGLYTMVQGIYHLGAFGLKGTEVSEDFNDITSDQVLRLPLDYKIAVKYVMENLIGKTIRIIARTPANTNRYGGRYYLFVIED